MAVWPRHPAATRPFASRRPPSCSSPAQTHLPRPRSQTIPGVGIPFLSAWSPSWCLAGRLALIRDFGTSLPYQDQWKFTGVDVLKPWLDGSLTLGSLFKPSTTTWMRSAGSIRCRWPWPTASGTTCSRSPSTPCSSRAPPDCWSPRWRRRWAVSPRWSWPWRGDDIGAALQLGKHAVRRADQRGLGNLLQSLLHAGDGPGDALLPGVVARPAGRRPGPADPALRVLVLAPVAGLHLWRLARPGGSREPTSPDWPWWASGSWCFSRSRRPWRRPGA